MIDPIFQISAYDYQLPDSQVAQEPATRRDGSRLLVVPGPAGILEDRQFVELPNLIRANDLLVINDTRVFPARLRGRKESGGQVELFLLHYPEVAAGDSASPARAGWAVVRGLVKSSKRPRPGCRLLFGEALEAEVLELLTAGEVRVRLSWRGSLDEVLHGCGTVPLPPYIRRQPGEERDDRQRYQTIYAQESGAVAAPTAGLHFSEPLLQAIRERGATLAPVTLHVGYGTFAPVRTTDIRDHEIHAEHVTVPAATVAAIHRAKAVGGRIWAVGTTSARALEFAAGSGELRAVSDWCRLYIYPGYEFRVVDNLITNFHLPQSSLLFMVSAFAGYERVRQAYHLALALGYRFYSYGDAMALIRT